MEIVDCGRGRPIVFVPGLQGRWEYMRRAVDALAERHRVITFSLADEPAARCPFDAAHALDSYSAQIARALDEAGLQSAAVCGVSFGGNIAIRFAARHPDRTAALILASTPGPGWSLSRDQRRYVGSPWLWAPVFFVRMPRRLRAEMRAGLPAGRDRASLQWEQARTLIHAPVSPARMARRALAIDAAETAANAALVRSPTLVIAGEPGLDAIVPVHGTADLARAIPGATFVELTQTGHLGCISRPREFAALVERFLARTIHAAA